MPQKSVFQSGGAMFTPPPPHFRKIWILFRVLERFSIVLEFLTIFGNSSVIFRAQLSCPKIFKTKFSKVSRVLQKSQITFSKSVRNSRAMLNLSRTLKKIKFFRNWGGERELSPQLWKNDFWGIETPELFLKTIRNSRTIRKELRTLKKNLFFQ